MSDKGHNIEGDWKLPMFLLLGVSACIGVSGLVLIYLAMNGAF